MFSIARHVQKHMRLLGVVESLDNGKPIRESRDADVQIVVRHLYHHAGWAQLAETEMADWRSIGLLTFIVVVVVMTSPSGAAYMGGQMSRRDEAFHQTLVVLEHICDVNQITKVTLAFCCPFWAEQQ